MLKLGGVSGMMLVVMLTMMYSSGTQYGVAASNNDSMSLAQMENTTLDAFDSAQNNVTSEMDADDELYWSAVGRPLINWGKLSFVTGLEVGYLSPIVGKVTGIAVPIGAMGATGLYLRKLWRES